MAMVPGPRNRSLVIGALVLAATAALGCRDGALGRLDLTVVDTGTGQPTPARLEVRDESGRSYVAPQALEVAGDCGWYPLHNWLPGVARWQLRRALRAEVPNPYTGTTQFYLAHPARLKVPPGRYRVRAFKGPEYQVATVVAEVKTGEEVTLEIGLQRWVDMPAEGWVSADDHLHIPRPGRRFDRTIALWMEAEDLHVANLLQMGLAQSIHITPQRSFGAPSVYRTPGALVASGQENPRTHLLGHSIILGAPEWIDHPESYLAYGRFWSRARQLGAISGFAHWGVGGADEGLAVWIPSGLLDFLEVLGFGLPYYEAWYQLLDLGIRVTPTAGTDYPCSPSLPGRERFYARVEEGWGYDGWIEAVRRGQTFVTNGPVLDFQVAGAAVGQDVHLEEPAVVAVRATVRFDPARDRVTALEVVGGGQVLLSAEAPSGAGEIHLDAEVFLERSTWLAARVAGHKLGETPIDFMSGLAAALEHVERSGNAELLARLPPDGSPRPTAAHSAPIFVTVEGSAPIARQPRAHAAVGAWLARLAELEARLEPGRLETLAGFPGRGDGLELADLEGGRGELLRAIAEARAAYHEYLHAQGLPHH
jgi:hypothetical protein